MNEQVLEEQHHRDYVDLAGPCAERMVLFGAGELGRKTLASLAALGIRPLAIADNNLDLQGRTLDGVPVLAPLAAVKRWASEALFVVSTYNPSIPVAQLRNAGAKRIITYATLFAAYPEAFLPFMCLGPPASVLSESDQIRRAFSLFRGEASQAEFVRQIERRLFLRFESPKEPLPNDSRESEYFAEDVYRSLPDEVFVDCGAFDGDTIRRFLKRRHGIFREIVAIEPDPRNIERLRRYAASLPSRTAERIRIIPKAVADLTGSLPFSATGMVSAGLAEHAQAFVAADTLDHILAEARPTLIKMDLEGGEPAALAGARRIIAETSPVLAVCIYHRAEHLWSLPLQIAELFSGYELTLRAHAEDCWDVSCYAVPPGRLPSAG